MSEQIQTHSPSACPMLTVTVKQMRRSLRAILPSTIMKETFQQPQCSVCGLLLRMEIEINPAFPETDRLRVESERHIARLLKRNRSTSSATISGSTTPSDSETTGE